MNTRTTDITTKRLLLRPFRDADEDAIIANLNDKRITATTSHIPYPYTRNDARAWLDLCRSRLDGAEHDNYAIDLEGELIGSVGLDYNREHRRAEVGYWISVGHWNRGIATEALRAAIDRAFGRDDCDRVFAHHYVGNEASGRVMEKIGMRREGVLRAHMRKDGDAKDCVCYGLLKQEWLALLG